MDSQNNQSEQKPSQSDEQAVPYIPPPPPQASANQARSPIVNTLIIIAVVALGGFMTFNFVGHGLTQTAGDSIDRSSYVASPTPSVSPTP